MTYKVVLSSSFRKSIKRLEKRYVHVKEDVKAAIQALLQTPRLGSVIPGGDGVRKLRLRNRDAGRGKSGGYRLLYYVVDEPTGILFLLLLYAKSDQDDVSRAELEDLLRELQDENKPYTG